ncbi:MAG: PAS domain-containing protein [Alphaproteobacteria bacterium]
MNDRPARKGGVDAPGTTRTTDLAAFRAQASPKAQRFYDYWDGLRQGRRMPSRTDIDPIEMREWLSQISLVDVHRDPFALVYRLVGSVHVTARGYDPTGRTVDQAYFGRNREPVLQNYRDVVETRHLVYNWEGSASRESLLRESEALFLPLSSDGETVDVVLVLALFERI